MFCKNEKDNSLFLNNFSTTNHFNSNSAVGKIISKHVINN